MLTTGKLKSFYQKFNTDITYILSTQSTALNISWIISDYSSLIIPKIKTPQRSLNLWETTCFEAFILDPQTQIYYELNISPSSEWNLFVFDWIRGPLLEAPLKTPLIPQITKTKNQLRIDIHLPSIRPKPMKVGISAVTQGINHTLDYWALIHCKSNPDFHTLESFILQV